MAQQETNSNIKILSVVWYKVLPAKFGGQKAVALFNKHLGLQVPLVCLCSKNNEPIKTSYEIQNLLPVSKMQFLNPVIWRKIYTVAKKEKATHLLLEFPYHGIAGIICKKLSGIKLIINTHNIEFIRFKEQNKWWWKLLYYFEGWTLKKADAVFFKTEADKVFAQKQFGLDESRLTVVPYGVEEVRMMPKQEAQAIIRQKHTIREDEKILLFAGTLDYEPNATAVVNIEKELIPLLNQQQFNYKIIVCGRNRLKQFQYLTSITDKQLVFAGEVNDMETYFMAADVFINPVITGGGIQTKTIDALSHHLNVVCFEGRLAGISNAENKIFSVEFGDWKAFTNAIMEAAGKTTATPPSFFETYNWNSIAVQAYQKMISI